MMMEQNRIATFSPPATATKANLRASCGLCTSPGRLWCTFSWPWGDIDEQKLSAREALLEQIARLTDNQVSTDEAEPEKTMLGPQMRQLYKHISELFYDDHFADLELLVETNVVFFASASGYESRKG
jgi:hypothetical protein